jgi:hypothetical protein
VIVKTQSKEDLLSRANISALIFLSSLAVGFQFKKPKTKEQIVYYNDLKSPKENSLSNNNYPSKLFQEGERSIVYFPQTSKFVDVTDIENLDKEQLEIFINAQYINDYHPILTKEEVKELYTIYSSDKNYENLSGQIYQKVQKRIREQEDSKKSNTSYMAFL